MPIRNLLLTLLLAAASTSAFSQQVISVREGETAISAVSISDLTRVRMAAGRIVKVRGNDGEVMVDADKVRGELFIRPLITHKPVNLFITTDSGSTFVLLLTPKSIPSDTLVLREQWSGAAPATGQNGAEPDQQGYTHEIRQLILAMARSDMPRGYNVQEVNRKVLLWKNTMYTLEREYQGNNYVGQVYRLTNTGSKQLVVAEPEFYNDGVLAVSVETMTLANNQSTSVYIVRKRLPNE